MTTDSMTTDSMTTDSATTTTIIPTSINGNKHKLQDKIEQLKKVLHVNPKQTSTLIILSLNMTLNIKGETWHHVFTATSGGSDSVYDLYTGNNTSFQTKLEASLIAPRGKRHFKSDIINNWEYLNIEQVKVSVNKDGIEKAYFIFNGTESNKTNWFSTNRILKSSYTDLTSYATNMYFSNKDHVLDNSQHRLFFMISKYDRVDLLQTKLLVLDAKRQKNVIVYYPFNFGPRTMESKEDSKSITKDSITTESTNTTKISTYTKGEINKTQDRIDKLKKVLHVDPKLTSNYIRSLISVYESRISAVSIGTVGISVISLILGTIIALDVVTNSKNIKRFIIRKYRFCRSFKCRFGRVNDG
ncbi:unnamed protein product [Mytilus coruscus]|uniref:Uncharacterized protein n=1 Tax=Mytilus coruscus TaxID=42192 RepID=A0A6J8CPQ8_MYTCO|nr:unnamed protein product [Mytilus coruscus]